MLWVGENVQRCSPTTTRLPTTQSSQQEIRVKWCTITPKLCAIVIPDLLQLSTAAQNKKLLKYTRVKFEDQSTIRLREALNESFRRQITVLCLSTSTRWWEKESLSFSRRKPQENDLLPLLMPSIVTNSFMELDCLCLVKKTNLLKECLMPIQRATIWDASDSTTSTTTHKTLPNLTWTNKEPLKTTRVFKNQWNHPQRLNQADRIYTSSNEPISITLPQLGQVLIFPWAKIDSTREMRAADKMVTSLSLCHRVPITGMSGITSRNSRETCHMGLPSWTVLQWQMCALRQTTFLCRRLRI